MQNTGIILKLIEVTHRWMREEGPIVSLYTDRKGEMIMIEEVRFVLHKDGHVLFIFEDFIM